MTDQIDYATCLHQWADVAPMGGDMAVESAQGLLCEWFDRLEVTT